MSCDKTIWERGPNYADAEQWERVVPTCPKMRMYVANRVSDTPGFQRPGWRWGVDVLVAPFDARISLRSVWFSEPEITREDAQSQAERYLVDLATALVEMV